MDLKEWIGILISLSASLAAMAYGFGAQGESLRRLKKDLDNIGVLQRNELSPFINDIRERLVRVESEMQYMRERFDKLEELLQKLFQKA